MNDAAGQSRQVVCTLLIAVAFGLVAARILAAERVLEPTVYQIEPGEKGKRAWPAKTPPRVATFSSNDVSRWATVRALVEQGTYVIGRRDRGSVALTAVAPLAAAGPVEAAALLHAGYWVRTRKSDSGIIFEPGFESVDKVLHPQTFEFYSSKPPLLATLMAGLYWILFQLGITFQNHPLAVVRALLLLVSGGLFLLYLRQFSRLAEAYGQTDWGRYFVVAAACFATLVTPFTNTFNNHTIATFCVVFALSPFLRILESVGGLPFRARAGSSEPETQREKMSRRDFVLTGFFAALTACLDLPAASFAMAVGAILLWLAPRQTLGFFVPAAVLPVAAFFLTNLLAVGQLRPAYSEFGGPWYEYEGSHWRRPLPGEVKTGIDWARFQESRAAYTFHVLLGHHGLFSLTPLWLLALAFVLRFSPRDLAFWLRPSKIPPPQYAHESSQDERFWQFSRAAASAAVAEPDPVQIAHLRSKILNLLAGLTLLISVVVVGFYLIRSDNYGGWTCGLRWLMWLSPLWLLCVLPVADHLAGSRAGRALAYVLLGWSIFSALFPITNPWRHPWLYQLMESLGWPGY